MAKFSISEVLRRRKRIRIGTLLACLALVFILGEFLVTQNPFGAKASGTGCDTSKSPYVCTIDTSGYIDVGGPSNVGTWFHPNLPSTVTPFQLFHDSSLTISGTGTVVEMREPMTLGNLTITDGATMTHSAITVAQAQGSSDSYANNKVDLNITDTLNLINKGKIDVTGKGFPGGYYLNSTLFDGFGSGPGQSGYGNVDERVGGGGGGHGGNGGNGGGGSYARGIGGSINDIVTDPSLSGSGGGGSISPRSDHTMFNSEGGKGGGEIRITAATMVLDASATIAADGGSTPKCDGNDQAGAKYVCGGGGSGGSINIVAQNLLKTRIWSAPIVATPLSNGGLGGNPQWGSNPGQSASVSLEGAAKDQNFGSMIHANGGAGVNASGGGGGGLIHVKSIDLAQNCTILPFSFDQTNFPEINYIPAECEKQDVVIDGLGQTLDSNAKAVSADTVRVWQADGTYGKACPSTYKGVSYIGYLPFIDKCMYNISLYTSPTTLTYSAGDSCDANPSGYSVVSIILPASSDPQCDSKRHLKSLTVTNNGILTHTALSELDMAQADTSKSLAANMTGTARWKKVDIETAGSVALTSGGKIDVAYKGYPGGTMTHYNGYGPGGGHGLDPHSVEIGFPSASDPASYGGVGGLSTMNGNYLQNPPASPPTYSDQDNPTDFGSGGGLIGSTTSGGCVISSPGGGRVFLLADSLSIDNGSMIDADGQNSLSCGNWTNSGPGAGGTINITLVSNIQAYVSPRTLGGASGGDNATAGGVGTVSVKNINLLSDASHNVYANGGNGTGGTHNNRAYAGGGGGGRILIRRVTSGGLSVKKTLTASKRAGVPNTTFDPYSLKIGDEIKVDLKLANLSPNGEVTVTDDLLSNGSAICNTSTANIENPNSALVTNMTSGKVVGGTTVQWTFTPTSDAEIGLYYYCTVAKK